MKFVILFTIFGIMIINQPQRIIAKKGKIFDMCSLAREMHRLGVSQNQLPDWICIALHESSYNTKALRVNRDKSQNWGIFQINDKRWCQPPPRDATGSGVETIQKSANLCDISCKALISDDISSSLECARYIKEISGFANWGVWKRKCQYHKPCIKKCF